MKNLKNFAATVAMLLCCITASAYDFEVDGIYYNITNSTTSTVGVTYETSDYNSYSGDVAIPSTVTYNDKVYTVTSIVDYAFYNCSSLTSITIPEGVTSIVRSAFEGCSSLTSIAIFEGSKLTNIGVSAFKNCSSLSSFIIPESVTSIGKQAFNGCSSLISITIPESVTSIENYTFCYCSSLTSAIIPEGVTSIGSDAFYGCSSLASIIIPEGVTSIGDRAFAYCVGLTSLEVPANVVSIGNAFFGCQNLKNLIIEDCAIPLDVDLAFHGCSVIETLYLGRDLNYDATYSTSVPFIDCAKALNSIEIGNSVTSIGRLMFANCENVVSVTIPAGVTSIGGSAFSGIKEVVLKSTTPPTLTSSSLISDYAIITVPAAAYNDYCAATYWADLTANITIDDADARVKNLTLEADEGKSSLQVAVGDDKLKYVTDLTISGTVNSYDFMIMRNKMPLLRHLNLEDATIVYNAYEHYTGYHTEDNVFPGYGLHNCDLLTLTLPKNITSVGFNAVAENGSLSEIVIPEGVTSIGTYAFRKCEGLATITIPESVTSIENRAFDYCSSLKNIVLPPTVETIDVYAFYGCSSLTEIRIPGSIRSVGDGAFDGCPNLNDVYVYTVEPISIGQNTFTKDGNNFVGTLHAPKVSYWDYYYDTQWSQFVGFAEFDEPYDNFYVEGDKVLDDTTGDIRGDEEGNDPDAEMGENSGIIVEDDIEQDLGDVDIEHDGEHGGSIIVGGGGHVHGDKFHFHINVTGGRWYFFCFPFDIKAEDIKLEGGAEWVFRYYDGEERACNGKGGWKNVTSDGEGNFLKAATGYIFQCSQDDVLILTAKDKKIKKEDKYNELVAHVTENAHDASWNFVGNPYLSYYEVTADDYSAPITVWDGSQYIAIRPGDDDYQLAPFEAFFVQKPEGKDKVNYDAERQHTYHQSQEAAAQARARRRTQAINPDRLLVNLTLTDGTATDKTRVVFNNSVSMEYEMECDAAKFSTAGVPQLYTIDSRAVKYAINERPVAEGIVTVGFTAPAQGNYTIAAPRMDTPMLLRDNATGTIHDFSEGSYEFASEAGTFDDRFTLMMKAGETSIDELESTGNGQQSTVIYDVAGRRVNEATEQGIYIKGNRKVVTL